MADETKKPPPLSDLTYFNSWVDPQEVNSARGREFIAALRQYDPNAQFTPTRDDQTGNIGYALQYDPSLLPGPSGTGQLGGANPATNGAYAGGSGFTPSWSTVQPRMILNDPNAVVDSPIYGRITPNSNIGGNESWLDWAGPLGVLGFGALMGGIPALYQGVFGQGAYGGGGAAAGTAAGATPAATSSGALSGFQVPGGATGAFNAATGVPAAAADTGLLAGFQVPGGASGAFNAAIGATGVSPSTAAILGDINSPSLFDVGVNLTGTGSGTDWWQRVRDAVGKLPPGLGGGTGQQGLYGGAGGGAGGGRGGYPYEDALSILARFYGVPEETAKRLAKAAQGDRRGF